MPEASTTTQPDPLDVIVTALSADGPRTAGQLATDIGLAYSTLTPRLRQLESDGRAKRVKDPTTKQTTWQATNGRPTEGEQAARSISTASTEPTEFVEPAPVLSVDPAGGGPASTVDVGDDDNTIDERDTHIDRAAAATTAGEPAPSALASDAPQEAVTSARKPKGTIAAGILEVTRAHPDDVFRVSQLSKALGGTSAGAIANAAAKLVVSGELTLVCEKPASYQAA